MKRALLILSCFLLLVVACKEDDPATLNVTVNGAAHFGGDGGTVTLDVSSNTSWSVSGTNSWCTVSPTSGSGNLTVTVSVAKSTDMSARSVTLTVNAEGVSPYSVKITQDKMASAISVDKPILSYVLAGGEQTINIIANVPWTAELEKATPWCHLGATSGTGNGSLVITIDPSVDVKPRSAAILIKGVGIAVPVKVDISQLGEGPSLQVSPTEASVDFTMQNVEVSTTSNLSYTISFDPASASEWISEVTSPVSLLSIVQKKHEFKVNANGTRAIRSAKIIFTNATEGTSAMYTLTQGVEPVSFVVTPTALVFGYKQTTKTLQVTSNVAWSAAVKSGDGTWCTLSTSSAEANDANKEITVTLDGANTAGRQTEITFTGAEITTPVVITLTQESPAVGAKGDSTALVDIYKKSIAKKAWHSTIKWDIENERMRDWKGVTVNASGRVVGLALGTASNTVYVDNEMDFEPLDALESLTVYILTTGIVGHATNPRIESALPTSIFELTNLKTLILDGQLNPTQSPGSVSIPATIGNLTKLERLIIKGSAGHDFQGATIPVEISNLKALKNLELTKTKFGGAFPAITGFTNLDSLTLEGNAFTNFPSQIGNLANLTYLRIVNNTVTIGTLPASIGSCTKLKSLTLNSSKFTGAIPTEIGNLSELTYLSLSGGGFTGAIPGSLGNLKKLKEIFLSSNGFTGSIPAGLGGMSALEKFYMSSNSAEFTGGLPTEFGNLSNLVLLDVSNSVMRNGTLPRTLGNLSNLTMLNVEGDSLVGVVPKELGNLKKVAGGSLNLKSNNFTEIEEGFSAIGDGKISTFNFQYNKLTKIPKDLANTSAASMTLTLSYNMLTAASFPADFGSTKLVNLDIGSNQFTTFPDCFYGLTSLTSLNAGNNQLTVFPAGLKSLVNLTTLNLFKNNMTGAIPDIFGNDGLSKLGQYGFNIKENLFTTDLPCPHTLRNRPLPYRAANVHDQRGAVAKPFTFTNNTNCIP